MPVISQISFDGRYGQITSLLGANGIGKSTLLKAVIGVNPVLAGSIRLNGRDISALSPLQRSREVAYVPQEEATNFDFIVEEFVGMGGLPWEKYSGGAGQGPASMEEVLEVCGLTDLRRRAVTRISGGEKRRALIARALIQNTAVILLDEPTANLDPAFHRAVVELVKRMRDQKKCVLLAMHDLSDGWELSDQIVLINSHHESHVGPADQVMTEQNLSLAYGVRVQIETGMNPDLRWFRTRID